MSARAAVTVLLLDFDGTVADTSVAWVSAARTAFAGHGYELDDELLNLVLENPQSEALPAIPESDARAIEQDLVEGIGQAYLACPPMPGLWEFLDQFAGLPKAIVTSSYREQLVTPYLREHGLDGHFPVIVGSEDTPRLKPSPEPILLALRLLRADGRGAWMIGDSAVDIAAARAAGIRSAGLGDPGPGGDLAAGSLPVLASLLTAIMTGAGAALDG